MSKNFEQIKLKEDFIERIKKLPHPIWKTMANLKDIPVSYLGEAEEKKGYISYMDYSKYQKYSDDTWNKDKRIMTKPGKILRKLYPHVADSDIEKASNEFVSSFNQEPLILVKGKDILHWYNGKNYDYDYNLSYLSNSCMKHEYCQSRLKLYSENPEHVSMLIAVKNDKLIGRALVWKTDKGFFLDRIYANDILQLSFINYAKANKWMYLKYYSSYDNPSYIMSNDNNYSEYTKIRMRVQLDWYFNEYKEYPYLDTMKNSNLNGDLTNMYDNTDYVLDSAHEMVESVDGEWIHVADAYRIGDAYYDEYDSRITRCDYAGDYILVEDSIEVDGNTYHENYVVEIDGENYYKRGDKVTEYKGEYYLSDKCDDNGIPLELYDEDGNPPVDEKPFCDTSSILYDAKWLSFKESYTLINNSSDIEF